MINSMPRWSGKPSCDLSIAEFFFVPEMENGEDRTTSYTQVNAIKKICNSCPIQIECGEYALTHNVLGYWAGTSEDTRRKLRQQLGLILEFEELNYGRGEGLRIRQETADEWEFIG